MMDDAETLCNAFPIDLKDNDAYGEIKQLGETIRENSEDLKSAAKILSGKEHLYPNLKSAYILALTIPVSVASNKRSFSKLKIVKNYLRTTMKQERLDSLIVGACSVDVLDSLCLDEIKRDALEAVESFSLTLREFKRIRDDNEEVDRLISIVEINASNKGVNIIYEFKSNIE